MAPTERKDRFLHFFVYLASGAALGGFLDVTVFGQPTPLAGVLFGSLIAICFQLYIWWGPKRRV